MAFKSSRRAGLRDRRGSQQCPWRSTESQEPQLGALLGAVPWEKGSLEGYYYFFFSLFLFLLLFPNLSSEQLRSPASQRPALFSSTTSLLFKHRHKARLCFFLLPKDK